MYIVVVPDKLFTSMWPGDNPGRARMRPWNQKDVDSISFVEAGTENEYNKLYDKDKTIVNFEDKDKAHAFLNSYGGWLINNQKVIDTLPLNIVTLSEYEYASKRDILETAMLESRLFAKQFINRENDPRVREFILEKAKDFPIDESDKKRLLFHFFDEKVLDNFREYLGDIIILESYSKWEDDTTVTNKNYMDKQAKQYNGSSPTYSL